jgi:hypothetical protein
MRMKPTSNNSWAFIELEEKDFTYTYFKIFKPQNLIMPMMIQVFITKTRDKCRDV